MYMMLSGEPPFNGKNDEDVLASVKKGSYNFKKAIWENISP
jgi:calcium-dependent protein kinase